MLGWIGVGVLVAVVLAGVLRLDRPVRDAFVTLRQCRQDLAAIRQQGPQAERRAYLESLLGYDAGALPPLGGWAASADFLILLAETILIRRPEVVVEFGPGASTLVALRCLELNGTGRLVSYDHDPDFAEITRFRARRLGFRPEVHSVPLEAAAEGWPGRWYAMPGLPERIDLLIVDGPPKGIHPETRGGAGPAVFGRLAPGATVLLDDAARPGERAVIARWRAQYPAMRFTTLGADKGAMIARVPDAPKAEASPRAEAVCRAAPDHVTARAWAS